MSDYINQHWADFRPYISVLIPFYNDDPSNLVTSLINDNNLKKEDIEIVVYDDGSNNDNITNNIYKTIESMPIAGRLITETENLGRSTARNRLSASARGEYLLFLDADMLPDQPTFLSQWIDLTKDTNPQVAFGGFSVLQATTDPAYAVHRLLALKSDCLPAMERSKSPAKNLCTSNLLVHGDVLRENPFDQSFTGWGWEDVEWAIRVNSRHDIHHPDISVTHMGLDTVPVLINKYNQSAANFVRMLENHPTHVMTYPSYRVATIMLKLQIARPARFLSHLLALNVWAPAILRAYALKVYRAAVYAEQMRAG